MGKKSGKAPNVKEAAEIEGRYGRMTNLDTLLADRPDQYNPFGSINWEREATRDPTTGEMHYNWTQRQNLSQPVKDVFDPMMNTMGTRAQAANMVAQRIPGEMARAPDWEQFGEAQGLEYDPTELRARAEDAIYQSQANRLNPRFDTERQRLEADLRGKGLRPGDRAYDAAMGSFGRERTDAYEQARLASITGGRAEAGQLFDQQVQSTDMANALRDQKIKEYLGKRSFSLGELEALNPTQDVTDLANLVTGGG